MQLNDLPPGRVHIVEHPIDAGRINGSDRFCSNNTYAPTVAPSWRLIHVGTTERYVTLHGSSTYEREASAPAVCKLACLVYIFLEPAESVFQSMEDQLSEAGHRAGQLQVENNNLTAALAAAQAKVDQLRAQLTVVQKETKKLSLVEAETGRLQQTLQKMETTLAKAREHFGAREFDKIVLSKT
jgi:hypothetical protein